MFGFDFKPIAGERTLQIAKPEKALIDLLYLYTFYNNEQALLDLRLNEDFLHDDLNLKLLDEYKLKFNNKALEKRIHLLKKIYDL